MTDKTKAILTSLLTLPADERAEIAAGLLASLDEVVDPVGHAEIAATREETERRLQDYREGKTGSEQGDKVMTELFAKYRK